MEETIAELRRQLEEERQALGKERKAREEAERLQGEAERRLQPNTLSQAIRVETDATLTTQGDATDPVNRLYPKRIVHWLDFPQLQEQVWRKFDRTAAFTSRPLFPSDTQIDYVVTNIQNRPIYSEASLRNFERDTVDNFVEMVIKALRDDEVFRHEFGIHGQVTFYDRVTKYNCRRFPPLLADPTFCLAARLPFFSYLINLAPKLGQGPRLIRRMENTGEKMERDRGSLSALTFPSH
jgi:hypothetical protein